MPDIKKYFKSNKQHPEDRNREGRRKLAEETLAAIEAGSYLHHNLATAVSVSKQNTKYYAPDSLLSMWASARVPDAPKARVSVSEISTIEGARYLSTVYAGQPQPPKIGILNFASAKKPGGGFLSGAQAQEESIARSSTLYPTLMTRVAQEFYTLHNRDPKGGYYSHAMIYSPAVVLFRDDQGGWVEPLSVDVLTSAAVNAGVVRKSFKDLTSEEEEKITRAMRERMGRVLYLFETQGIRNIVLGSFGTGVFQNDVPTVAGIWAEFLLVDDARFAKSFDHVVFAVIGRKTFEDFEAIFTQFGHRNQTS